MCSTFENESVQVQISDDTQIQQEELSIELAEQENSTIEEDLTSKVNSSSDTNNGTIEQVEQVVLGQPQRDGDGFKDRQHQYGHGVFFHGSSLRKSVRRVGVLPLL